MPITRDGIFLRWLGRDDSLGLDAGRIPLPFGCLPPFVQTQTLPGGTEQGTDCSYCNGEIHGGSRNKTPYVVGTSPQPRQIAHAMQQRATFSG
jgi:hypothetical protein